MSNKNLRQARYMRIPHMLMRESVQGVPKAHASDCIMHMALGSISQISKP